MMRFSIIIPAYNYGHYLATAIEAALNQGDTDYEVLIVDDGSTDNTRDVAKAYLDRPDSPVRYVYQRNRGLAGARNRGIDEARGDWLLFPDADDRLLPDALKKFNAFLEQHPQTDMVFAGYIGVDAQGRGKTKAAAAVSGEADRDFRGYVLGRFTMANGAILFNKRILERLRYPESLRNNEDYVVNAQTFALFHCASFPDPVLEVHAHEDRLRHNLETLKVGGLSVVDLLFNPEILPLRFMPLRQHFLSRMLLSRFRTFYKAAHYREAMEYFRQAVNTKPVNILSPYYMKRFLISWWQARKHNSHGTL